MVHDGPQTQYLVPHPCPGSIKGNRVDEYSIFLSRNLHPVLVKFLELFHVKFCFTGAEQAPEGVSAR
jgi:hypothetical protein